MRTYSISNEAALMAAAQNAIRVMNLKEATFEDDKQVAVNFDISRFEVGSLLKFIQVPGQPAVFKAKVGRTANSANAVFVIVINPDGSQRHGIFYLSSIAKNAVEAIESAQQGIKAIPTGLTYAANHENFSPEKGKTNLLLAAEQFPSQRYLGKALVENNIVVEVKERKQIKVRSLNNETRTQNSTLMNLEIVDFTEGTTSKTAAEQIAALNAAAVKSIEDYEREMKAAEARQVI